MIRYPQINFSKGVISERLLGRVDVEAYNSGLRKGQNIVVLKEGGFTIRPGFRYISEATEDEWLFPFQFSDEQAYALAFGQEYMQPLALGGVVLEDELEITGITAANPAVVEIAFHGNSAGDQIFFTGIQGALGDYMNGRVFTVIASLDDDHFSIDFDTTALPAFTTATGGTTLSGAVPPPPAPPTTPTPTPTPDPPPVYGGGDPKLMDPRAPRNVGTE